MSNAVAALVGKIQAVVSIINRRRWLAISVAAALAPVLAVGVAFVPNRYEAKAQVYVDTQTVLKPLMSGLTFEPDIDQQVRMLARTLISRPNLQRLLEVPDLQLNDPDPERREETVSRLMSKLRVVSAGADNLYEISYRGQSPEQARRLVEAIVELFVQSGVSAKQRDSQDAGQFIEDQIRSYEEKLVEAENRLKEFKVRNFGASGVSSQDYFTRVSVLSDEAGKLRVELNAAEKAMEAYRRSLQGEVSQASKDGVSSPAVAEIETRLDAQYKLLDEALHRFTEQHPDVINGRRVIADLKAELARRKDAAARGLPVPGAERMNAANPVYQKLRISLAETEAQVASLRAQLANKQSALEEARAVGDRMPQVEAELAQLNRDYDVIRKNYEVMVSRREAAQLGVKLNESSQMAEFRVVEPPKVSGAPVFPSRLQLSLMAALFTFVVGIAAAVAVNFFKPTVDSVTALKQLSRRPVLGSVSMQVAPHALHRQRVDAVRFKGAVAALMLLQAIWLGWVAFHS
ncbi:XrtA system polysaccharide chain length determinant [Azohydromonas aeria]|uniref:XrtA system polysaccharide chain length determinant n=1 Tax=Azohydromonas aeria TaxID=2590212 RepID=UPI0012FCD465|nr:XrtA system polysaccharide chain length determinant [Azohydromonas aeria]